MNKLKGYQVGITQTKFELFYKNRYYRKTESIFVWGKTIRLLRWNNLGLHAGCFKGEDLESKGVQFYKDLAHDSSRQLQSAFFLPFWVNFCVLNVETKRNQVNWTFDPKKSAQISTKKNMGEIVVERWTQHFGGWK